MPCMCPVPHCKNDFLKGPWLLLLLRPLKIASTPCPALCLWVRFNWKRLRAPPWQPPAGCSVRIAGESHRDEGSQQKRFLGVGQEGKGGFSGRKTDFFWRGVCGRGQHPGSPQRFGQVPQIRLLVPDALGQKPGGGVSLVSGRAVPQVHATCCQD